MYARPHAEQKPDHPAIVMSSGEIVTFGKYEAAANRYAHLFRRLGLRRGDHVAVCMENSPRLLEFSAGAERTGLYYTCVNSHLTATEIAYIVDDCDAQVLLASPSTLEACASAVGSMQEVKLFLTSGPTEPPFVSIAEALADFPSDYVEDEQLGAAMLYSSGTTGRPKGIQRPLPDNHPGEPLPLLQFASRLFGFRDDMTTLSPAPMYHSGPQAALSAALRIGATTVVMERFDAAEFLELVARHRVTHTQLVPTMFIRLLKLDDEVRQRADVSSLEFVVHAAAPCPEETKRAMIDWWGPIINEYYGATEANGFTFCTTEEWLAHPGTVGRAILGDVVITDDQGQPVPRGEAGTVWFVGATNFEYYGDREKTEGATGTGPVSGGSTVGDVGYLDADGFLHLTDRKSHMIISGGVNIYPQEAENVLASHPIVADVAVIGVPNHEWGEEVKAVVQLEPGSVAGPELEHELLAFCRERLAAYKCPKSVDFVDKLPRLPTGKLLKRLLRDQYQAAAQPARQS